MPEFMDSWYFIGGMGVLLIGLVGLYFFMQNKGSGE